MGKPPLVLTVKLDRRSYGLFEKLRQRYFPRDRNLVPAHVTLFHALPGDRELSLATALENVCLETPLLNLSFDKVRFLGRGVAIEVNAPGLVRFRSGLAAEWEPWLTAQDKQGYRPHITIQNKVDASEARRLFESMVDTWQVVAGTAAGVQLWYYRAGPWDLAREFMFKDQKA